MKILVPVVIAILVVAVVVILVVRARSRTDTPANPTLTMEQKLQILADCGLRLSDPFTPQDLLESWGREDYEKPGFDLVLVGLGMTEEREPWRKHCANLWHFDAECIEDHGDYKRIVERMVEMARGSLPLEIGQHRTHAANTEANSDCSVGRSPDRRRMAIHRAARQSV